jgi:hypothetical protein
LIIEILSPDDETAETLARVADFLRFGVAHIWIANPYKHLCRRPTAKVSKYCPDLVVETDLVCRVDFNALFAKVDEPTE